MTALFEDPHKAEELKCDSEDTSCDILDRNYPLEESLVSNVIEYIVKLLSGAIYKPSDSINDASDNLSELVGYLRRNMKSQFQKQLEE